MTSLSRRYKGIGRPRHQDYLSTIDRVRQGNFSIFLMMVSALLCGLVYYYKNPISPYFQPTQLISPLVGEVHAQEVIPVTPTPTPEPEPTTEWEAIVIAATKVSKIYNYPAKVVISQAALESARGNSNFCKERKNCLGIGAYDSDPNQAYTFENYEQSFVEYMRIIKKVFPECWEKRDDAEGLLKCLKVNKHGKMYATDPHYVNKVMSMKEWNINK